jgi:hypothetical protein
MPQVVSWWAHVLAIGVDIADRLAADPGIVSGVDYADGCNCFHDKADG